jgi:hypothetical protein
MRGALGSGSRLEGLEQFFDRRGKAEDVEPSIGQDGDLGEIGIIMVGLVHAITRRV